MILLGHVALVHPSAQSFFTSNSQRDRLRKWIRALFYLPCVSLTLLEDWGDFNLLDKPFWLVGLIMCMSARGIFSAEFSGAFRTKSCLSNTAFTNWPTLLPMYLPTYLKWKIPDELCQWRSHLSPLSQTLLLLIYLMHEVWTFVNKLLYFDWVLKICTYCLSFGLLGQMHYYFFTL